MIPRCLSSCAPVRAASHRWVATDAPVVQIFWPLMTYSSPSFTARVRSDPRSLPASGSL